MTHLSIAALGTGAILAALGLWALLAPERLSAVMTAFPRSRPAAWALTILDLTWAGLLLQDSPLGFLDRYKPALVVITPVAILLVGFLVDELLAPRALGGLLLLVPAVILAAVREHDSPLRVVMSVVAYAIVIKGFVLVLAPYNFRRSWAWIRAGALRFRLWSLCALGCGLGLLLLGLFIY